MIGFKKVPTGRMGNVLIQYIFLQQLAKRLQMDTFYPQLPYSEYFDNFQKKKRGWKHFFKDEYEVRLTDIEKMGMEDFLKEAKVKDEEGIDIVLKPPVLGHLLEFEDDDPGQYIHIKEKYIIGLSYDDSKINIALHFRGTDFKEWNEKASLGYSYYKDAIEFCVQELGADNIRFLLFTDDNGFETFVQTTNYLQEKGYEYVPGSQDNFFIHDFITMSQCDVIVSSPSTFAIMATVIGKKGKRVIHNQQWMQYCLERNDTFWVQANENSNPYYHIWKTI